MKNPTPIQQVGELLISLLVLVAVFWGLFVKGLADGAEAFALIAGYAVLQAWFNSSLLGRLLGQGTPPAAPSATGLPTPGTGAAATPPAGGTAI